MVAALPWKMGLYVLKVTLPWGCSFWTSGLAYDNITINPNSEFLINKIK